MAKDMREKLAMAPGGVLTPQSMQFMQVSVAGADLHSATAVSYLLQQKDAGTLLSALETVTIFGRQISTRKWEEQDAALAEPTGQAATNYWHAKQRPNIENGRWQDHPGSVKITPVGEPLPKKYKA